MIIIIMWKKLREYRRFKLLGIVLVQGKNISPSLPYPHIFQYQNRTL